jgi:hypothetical protein
MRETKAQIMEGVESTASKVVGNNTVEYTRPDGKRVIRLHHTDIVVFDDLDISLYSGGWRTVTTKARINEYLPNTWNVFSDKRVWYLGHLRVRNNVFEEGITIHLGDGTVTGEGKMPDAKMVRAIRKYSNAFAAALPVDQPDGGDCWGCSMFEKSGMGDESHLISHIEEKYYVPSLLVQVLKTQGAGKAWYWTAFKQGNGKEDIHRLLEGRGRDTYARWLYKFMYDRIIDGKPSQQIKEKT